MEKECIGERERERGREEREGKEGGGVRMQRNKRWSKEREEAGEGDEGRPAVPWPWHLHAWPLCQHTPSVR